MSVKPQQIATPDANPTVGIVPLNKGDFYSSPQPMMVIFTLITSLSIIGVMMVFVFNHGYHRYIGGILSIYYLLRFLCLAFSNPGLAIQANQIQDTPNSFYCKICQIYISRKTKHCSYCNVCISGWDHHCIFVGKCIGRKNLCLFKEFIFLIFTILLYGLVLTIQQIPNVQVLISPDLKH